MNFSRPAVAGTVMLFVSVCLLGYLVRSPFEITRLRNSLIASVGSAADFQWTPESPPGDYAMERQPAPPRFRDVAQATAARANSNGELDRALANARHLSGGDISTGAAIQSDSLAAYSAIVTNNAGYCADYTQVFNALNLASGVPVREWGMSFDGFSGKGHAFSEVYDSRLAKWVFVDSFYSFLMVDPVTGTPLSVMEFRDRLLAADASLADAVTPIDEGAFAFKPASKAVDYYAAGANQFFLWFGNDVFSYDSNALIKSASRFGRSAEQAVAILIGAHPRIRIAPSDSGQHWVTTLNRIRQLFMLAVVLGVLALCLYAYALSSRGRQARPTQVPPV